MLMANADVPARFRMEGSQLLAGASVWHAAACQAPTSACCRPAPAAAPCRLCAPPCLSGWHSALQDEAGKEGVAADGQQPCSAKTEQTLLALDVFMPLLVRAVSWALQPAHLDLLGLADGTQACQPPCGCRWCAALHLLLWAGMCRAPK